MSASSEQPSAPAARAGSSAEQQAGKRAFMRAMRERRLRRRRGTPAPWEQATIEMDVISALYGNPKARKLAYDTQPSSVRPPQPPGTDAHEVEAQGEN